MAEDDATLVARMLCDEARQMVTAQSADLGSLRARSITLLTVGSAIAALFGSQLPAARSDVSNVMIIAALVTYGVSVLAAIEVVRPHDFTFDHRINEQLDLLRDGSDFSVRQLALTWAEGYDNALVTNETEINRLTGWFAVVCGLVGLQAIAWGVAVLAA